MNKKQVSLRIKGLVAIAFMVGYQPIVSTKEGGLCSGGYPFNTTITTENGVSQFRLSRTRQTSSPRYGLDGDGNVGFMGTTEESETCLRLYTSDENDVDSGEWLTYVGGEVVCASSSLPTAGEGIGPSESIMGDISEDSLQICRDELGNLYSRPLKEGN